MTAKGDRSKSYDLDGLVEGVDYKVVKGMRVPLKPNVDRACPGCERALPGKSFYSSLHKLCRKCIIHSEQGHGKKFTLSGLPNRKQTKREKGELKKMRAQADALARQTVVNKGVPPDVPEVLRPFYEKALSKIANRQAKASLEVELNVAKQRVEASHFEKELALRTLARRRLIHYVQRFNANYLAGWVHKDIARRLERFVEQVKEGKSPRLLLLVPPRHGKSKLASEELVSWVFGHFPDWEVISTSYNVGLPLAFSRRIRDRMRDPNYHVLFPETKLHEDSQAIEEWSTTVGGGYRAAGVGGGITGKGAKILIVDDPVKNWEEADSPVIRDNTWDWYLSTARSRLAPGGGVLGIQTWWNDDDWAGRIQQAMKTGGEQFEIIKYPAINEGYDEYLASDEVQILEVASGMEPPEGAVLLRKEGTALHPERYSLKELLMMKSNYAALGQKRMWSALYQQNPIPEEGIQFTRDMFIYAEDTPTDPKVTGMNVYCAWDFAITEKQHSDWTVGYCIAQDWNGVLWELDVVRFRSEDNKVIADAIIDMYSKWGVTVCGVENGQIWKGIKSTVMSRAQELLKGGFNFEELNTLTDKKVRAAPLRGQMQLRRLRFKKDAPWREVVDTELLRFPGGKHDDVVDALAWAVRTALNHAVPSNPMEMAKRRQGQPQSWKERLKLIGLTNSGSHMSA
jgi:predicted phage terminase large subunit-like protein